MKRGEIWALRGTGYASKPRPVLVIQNDNVASFDSVIVCLLTSFDSTTIKTRTKILPSPQNGLNKPSFVMTDKIVTVTQDMFAQQIGYLTKHQMSEVSTQLKTMLDLP